MSTTLLRHCMTKFLMDLHIKRKNKLDHISHIPCIRNVIIGFFFLFYSRWSRQNSADPDSCPPSPITNNRSDQNQGQQRSNSISTDVEPTHAKLQRQPSLLKKLMIKPVEGYKKKMNENVKTIRTVFLVVGE